MIKAMKDFQIPMRVEVDKDTHSQTFGRFTTEAYERGFGTTVGNALRRVLLSSLTGAAVTTVKIEGVLHEFSTIPGITEDVTSIILNVKGLRLAVHTDKPKTLRLKKKGPGEAKGSDIIHDADVTILTPNLHIATLDKDASFDMEMTVKHGRGYVPAERNKEEGLPIGVIAIDSVFSPIKRVNFHVENARVGRMTDYDKLTLEIWTDGTISPRDALSTAAGMRQIDRVLIRVGRSFRARTWQMVSKIYLPAMRVPVVNGVRLGLGVAVIGTLLAETKLSNRGVGFLVINSYSTFDMPRMYALLIVVFVIAIGANALVSRLGAGTSHAKS